MGQAFRVFLTTCFLLSAALAQQTAGAPLPCSEPEQKQFDFWLGEWQLTWPGNKEGEIQHGANIIRRKMDGCVVEENFSGGESIPLRGMSVSIFSKRLGKWQQTWVDNQGAYLDFTGEFRDGQMILQREAVGPDGSRVLQRMVFKNIHSDEFDWTWEASKDGGTSWQVQWPIHYKRK